MKNNLTYIRIIKFISESLRADVLKAFILIICLTVFVRYLSGQPDSSTFIALSRKTVDRSVLDEKVLLKTDRELYLCGESIYFTAFTIEGNWFLPVSLSSILYAELYNQDCRIIANGKFSLTEGKTSGALIIPRKIATDFYYLRVYTNYMKNFGVRQFCEHRLKIVNPFLDYMPGQLATENQKVINYEVLPEVSRIVSRKFSIVIETDKKEYGNRDEVKVKIITMDKYEKPLSTELIFFASLKEKGNKADSNISFFEKEISVQDLRRIYNDKKLKSYGELKYLPETDGDIISGRLIYRDKQPAANIVVLQAFTGRSAFIESSVTDADGCYRFLVRNEVNRGDLILKILDKPRDVSLIPDDEFYADFIQHSKEILRLTDGEINLMKKQFINIQVNDAYSSEVASESEEVIPETSPFYGRDYEEYRFNDYAKLPNMKEFIFEIIEGVISSRENKQDKIKILDEGSFREIGPDPLIIIDGVPVNETSAVTGLDPEKVRCVRVIRNKYFYKKQIFDGILDIITYDGTATSFSLPKDTYRYKFIHTTEKEPLIIPSFVQADKGRIPVYRNLLYMNSSVSTNEEGIATLSFYTPDNSGTYVIQCLGLTHEGLAGEGSSEFTVGEKVQNR